MISTLSALLPAMASPVLNLKLLDAYPDARCLDGSPAAFYFGHPQVPTTRWLIWGEGKAWCLSEKECFARAGSKDGRGGWKSSGWPGVPGSLPSTLPWGAAPCYPGRTPDQAWGCQMSSDCELNPAFCGFNMVYLKTCDGGSWSGNRSGVSPSGLYYAGQAIIEATARELLSLGADNATELVIGGGSAGALGTYLHADRWVKLIDPARRSKVAAIADCGFFRDLGPANAYHRGFEWVASYDGMRAAVDSNCAAVYPEENNLCLMAEHIAPFISTPLFALQARFDSWQKPNICGVPCDTAAGEQEFGDKLIAKLRETVLSKPGNGAFVDSCLHHCGGSGVYKNANLTQAAAVKFWYEHGPHALPDDGRLISNASYPCTLCCSGKQPQEV